MIEPNPQAEQVPVEQQPAVNGTNAHNESVAAPGVPFTATIPAEAEEEK